MVGVFQITSGGSDSTVGYFTAFSRAVVGYFSQHGPLHERSSDAIPGGAGVFQRVDATVSENISARLRGGGARSVGERQHTVAGRRRTGRDGQARVPVRPPGASASYRRQRRRGRDPPIFDLQGSSAVDDPQYFDKCFIFPFSGTSEYRKSLCFS